MKMSKFIFVSVLMVIIASVLISEALPVCTEGKEESLPLTGRREEVPSNENLVTIILGSIQNNNASLATIRRRFKNVPSITVCVPVIYIITCDEETDCNKNIVNCRDGYAISQIWTSFDTKNYYGNLIYYFMMTWSTLPGFDWNDNPSFVNAIVDVNVPELPCLNSIEDLDQSLSHVTTLMLSLSQNKMVIPPFDLEAVEGFATNTINTENSHKIAQAFLYLCAVVATLLNISTQQFISKKIIPTKSGKPLFYFQYWAAMLLGAALICAYYSVQHPHKYVALWYFVPCTIINLFLWAIVVYISTIAEESTEKSKEDANNTQNASNKAEESTEEPKNKETEIKHNVLSYSSPAAVIPCRLGHFLWSLFGHGVTLLLIFFLVYSIPNIVIVYYLYPIQTIKRVPLLLGGLFSMILLVARLIYLMEKLSEHSKYMCGHKLCGCSRQETFCCRKISCCKKRQDDDYHFSYYANVIIADLKKIRDQATDIVRYRHRCLVVTECLSCFIIMFETCSVLFILLAYGFGQIVFANFVFENARNQNLDSSTSIIIAVIPTILVTVVSGAGIGLFFKFSAWSLMKQKDIAVPSTGDHAANENDEIKEKNKMKEIYDYVTLDKETNFSMSNRPSIIIRLKSTLSTCKDPHEWISLESIENRSKNICSKLGKCFRRDFNTTPARKHRSRNYESNYGSINANRDDPTDIIVHDPPSNLESEIQYSITNSSGRNNVAHEERVLPIIEVHPNP